MRVIVNASCIGCGLCTDVCHEVFSMSDNVAKAIDGDVPGELEDCVRDAEKGCPVNAIEIE